MAQTHIEQSIDLNAPPEFVWQAITEPKHINQWFGTEAEVDLRVGGAIHFAWGDDHTTGEIVTLDPPHTFAFRWRNNVNLPTMMGDNRPITLVTYQLEKTESGTRLTVLETGFDAMPDDAQQIAFKQNTTGWHAELNDLVAYIESEDRW